MTRARELARLGNINIIAADSDYNVGIGSTIPDARLDVLGIISATSFTGNLSGSSTGLTGTPDITIRNVTGVAATFTGQVTYEDVTNIDSLGILTARTGVRVTAGGVIVTAGIATFGADIDANAGIDVDGHTELDDLGVAGVSTFAGLTTVTSTDAFHSKQLNISGIASVGVAVTIYGSTGIVSATTLYADTIGDSGTVYTGDGSGLSGVVSGIEVLNAGSSVGSSLTALNFASGATFTSASSGFTTITIASGGLSTSGHRSASGIVSTLYLSDAQEHQCTTTGLVTFTSSGGVEGESHTLRITSSGISTVGFSTYFLWPSGAAPNLSGISDGSVHLVSFTVNRAGGIGAGVTQLLSGASLHFS